MGFTPGVTRAGPLSIGRRPYLFVDQGGSAPTCDRPKRRPLASAPFVGVKGGIECECSGWTVAIGVAALAVSGVTTAVAPAAVTIGKTRSGHAPQVLVDSKGTVNVLWTSTDSAGLAYTRYSRKPAGAKSFTQVDLPGMPSTGGGFLYAPSPGALEVIVTVNGPLSLAGWTSSNDGASWTQMPTTPQMAEVGSQRPVPPSPGDVRRPGRSAGLRRQQRRHRPDRATRRCDQPAHDGRHEPRPGRRPPAHRPDRGRHGVHARRARRRSDRPVDGVAVPGRNGHRVGDVPVRRRSGARRNRQHDGRRQVGSGRRLLPAVGTSGRRRSAPPARSAR